MPDNTTLTTPAPARDELGALLESLSTAVARHRATEAQRDRRHAAAAEVPPPAPSRRTPGRAHRAVDRYALTALGLAVLDAAEATDPAPAR